MAKQFADVRDAVLDHGRTLKAETPSDHAYVLKITRIVKTAQIRNVK